MEKSEKWMLKQSSFFLGSWSRFGDEIKDLGSFSVNRTQNNLILPQQI